MKFQHKLLKGIGLIFLVLTGTEATYVSTILASDTITLEKSIYFIDQSDDEVVVPTGTYELEAADVWLRLIPSNIRTDAVLIKAKSFEHQETISSSVALSLPGNEKDLHHLVLLLPNGKSLEAVGTYSGTRPRRLNTQSLTQFKFTQLKQSIGTVPTPMGRVTKPILIAPGGTVRTFKVAFSWKPGRGGSKRTHWRLCYGEPKQICGQNEAREVRIADAESTTKTIELAKKWLGKSLVWRVAACTKSQCSYAAPKRFVWDWHLTGPELVLPDARINSNPSLMQNFQWKWAEGAEHYVLCVAKPGKSCPTLLWKMLEGGVVSSVNAMVRIFPATTMRASLRLGQFADQTVNWIVGSCHKWFPDCVYRNGSERPITVAQFREPSGIPVSAWQRIGCPYSTGRESDQDRDFLSDVQETCLARYYHPILVLHEDVREEGWPSSADWFLRHSTFKFFIGGSAYNAHDENLVPRTIPSIGNHTLSRGDNQRALVSTEQNLQACNVDPCAPIIVNVDEHGQPLSAGNEEDLILHSTDPTPKWGWMALENDPQTGWWVGLQWYAKYFLDLDNRFRKGVLPHERAGRPPIYTHVYPSASGGVNIQYWDFFPYNGTLYWHEGDWEHITLKLDNQLNLKTGEGEAATYYGHADAWSITYHENWEALEQQIQQALERRSNNPEDTAAQRDVTLLMQKEPFLRFGESTRPGKHPLVYVARQSHASYWSDSACDNGGTKIIPGVTEGVDECPNDRALLWYPDAVSAGFNRSEVYIGEGLWNLGERSFESAPWERFGGLWGGELGKPGGILKRLSEILTPHIPAAIVNTVVPDSTGIPGGPLFKADEKWNEGGMPFLASWDRR